MEEVPTDDWLSTPSGVEMEAQTLQQQNGYAVALLHVLAEDDERTWEYPQVLSIHEVTGSANKSFGTGRDTQLTKP